MTDDIFKPAAFLFCFWLVSGAAAQEKERRADRRDGEPKAKTSDTTLPIGRNGSRGDPTSLIRLPSVQKELSLNEEQNAKVTTIIESVNKARKDLLAAARGKTAEARKKREQLGKQLAADYAKAQKHLVGVLDAKQLKRLQQVALQLRGIAAFSDAEVVAAVGLDKKQTKQVAAIMAKLRTDQLQLFKDVRAKKLDARKAAAKRTELRAAAETKLVEILNDDQKKKRAELLGPPFKFR